jgi:hypothetical protein
MDLYAVARDANADRDSHGHFIDEALGGEG